MSLPRCPRYLTHAAMQGISSRCEERTTSMARPARESVGARVWHNSPMQVPTRNVHWSSGGRRFSRVQARRHDMAAWAGPTGDEERSSASRWQSSRCQEDMPPNRSTPQSSMRGEEARGEQHPITATQDHPQTLSLQCLRELCQNGGAGRQQQHRAPQSMHS
ncbi:hypothetical protein NDU88_000378 [Pleurodeles waltl]|uniref:Uncharacterized protein n=1 Tax=Pleurodeles waltl TaxID=8319 RepID=A0AAV7UR52_PLEWA|nr:hypothetical protein NDU88_000378 [Pleurodeles waltl]